MDRWLNSAASPSGRWVLEWEDESQFGLDGAITVTPGRARVCFDGRLDRVIAAVERPQDGVISDEGTALIIDWLTDRPDRPKYKSAVLISIQGKPTIVHAFRANAGDLLRESDPDLVHVTFCDTPTEDEANWVEFRLSTGERVRQGER